MNEVNWFWLALLCVMVGLFLGMKAFGQTPTPTPTETPVPTTTPTPTAMDFEPFRNIETINVVGEEPLASVNMANAWMMGATISTNIEPSKRYWPLIRVVSSQSDTSNVHFRIWYNRDPWPGGDGIVSCTVEVGPLKDEAGTERVLLFRQEDQSIGGVRLVPVE